MGLQHLASVGSSRPIGGHSSRVDTDEAGSARFVRTSGRRMGWQTGVGGIHWESELEKR